MALDDDRGVSETASIAALVVLTVVVTASIGVGVLISSPQEDSDFDAEFTFQYFSGRQALLVTYVEGENLTASNVVFRGTTEVTWAELAGPNSPDTISPGTQVQLTPDNEYGSEISESTSLTVVYVEGNNETELATWNGPSGEG